MKRRQVLEPRTSVSGAMPGDELRLASRTPGWFGQRGHSFRAACPKGGARCSPSRGCPSILRQARDERAMVACGPLRRGPTGRITRLLRSLAVTSMRTGTVAAVPILFALARIRARRQWLRRHARVHLDSEASSGQAFSRAQGWGSGGLAEGRARAWTNEVQSQTNSVGPAEAMTLDIYRTGKAYTVSEAAALAGTSSQNVHAGSKATSTTAIV